MNKNRMFGLLVTILCLLSCIISASAAGVTVSKATTSFGTLSGSLSSSFAELNETGFLDYQFHYETEITRLPSDSTLVLAVVELVNSATGSHIYDETVTNEYYTNKTRCGGNIEMQNFENIRGENAITITVFGAHEARDADAVVIYSRNTYNLERDHGIV